MSILQGFYQLIFGPLELLFEIIYGIAYNVTGNIGAAIIPLSLAMNFLALPFYNRADAIQKEEREREKQLAPGVNHIKKTFKADERYMMLRAFYRVNGYNPVYTMRCFLPLLLEIPFFVAAYHFLSNLSALQGAHFGILTDLGMPDGLLSFGGFKINLLPVLMTLINIISSNIYTKDLSGKDKIQLYGVAAVFFILLYDSPSGLVFYWTLNNLFSLVKNIINSVKHRKIVTGAVLSVLGILIILYGSCKTQNLNRLFIIITGLVFQIPVLKVIFGRKKPYKSAEVSLPQEDNLLNFILGCLFLAVLTGLLIPSFVIKSSPAEFIVVDEYLTPLIYILSAFLLAAGTFLVWFGLFYYLANAKWKKIIAATVWILSVIAIANYMLFGTNLDNLSPELKYDIGLNFTVNNLIINTEVIIFFIAAALIIWTKKKRIVRFLYPVLIAAVLAMSVYNIICIAAKLPQIKYMFENGNDKKASFILSRNGKNVIVFMLDRGISSYVPYLFQDNQELARQFDGFTWYPNTLSYGTRTNTGSPAVFGGYEYTPEEMNKRSSELLADKQNEALKIMPVLFDRAGYRVTVFDPPYAGYTLIPNLSIFDEYKNIRKFNTGVGQFNKRKESPEVKQRIWKRNIFCYSIMKTLPFLLQSGFYQDGTYYNPYMQLYSNNHISVVYLSKSASVGISESFMNAYSALQALPEMTHISDEETNTFLMMANDTVHNSVILQEPQYEPAKTVDNTVYDNEHAGRFTINGRTLIVDTAYRMRHYQSSMAAFIQLGKWFEYMREQGVYDNTRIIIVADHGWPMEQFSDMLFGRKNAEKTSYNAQDAMAYNPLFMVKDFNEKGFKTDNQFMTNADTPFTAMHQLIENPVNPFTNMPITNAPKFAEEQHVFYTDFWGTEHNNGNTFLPGSWYILKNHNIFNMNNWSKLGDY